MACVFVYSLQTIANETIRITSGQRNQSYYITATAGKQFTVDWGDGSVSQIFTGTGAIQNISYSYPYSHNGKITMTGNSEGCLFPFFDNFSQTDTLDLSECPSIVNLQVSRNLRHLDLSNCVNLQSLICTDSKLQTLDLSDCVSFRRLSCAYGQLTNIVLSNNKSLEQVRCRNNYLSLSNLYDITVRTIDPYSNNYGIQTPPAKTAATGEPMDLSSELELGGIPTNFIIKWGGSPAAQDRYSIEDGILTFHYNGYYDIEMSNPATVCGGVIYTSISVKSGVSDATLSFLIPTNCEGDRLRLNPTFKWNIYNYEADVNPNVSSVCIFGAPSNSKATVSGNGTFPLEVGENIFTVSVTSEDGIAQLDYVVKINRPIGVVETGRVPSLQVYPNPTKGELRIRNYVLNNPDNSGQELIKDIDVFDIIGQKQKAKCRKNEECEIIIDISHLSAGIYFLRIDNEAVKVVKE